MFDIGEFVVYGNKGVCEVIKIGPIDIPGMLSDREYYTLSQVYTRGSTIFVPVDKEDSGLRKTLTQSEARNILEEIKDYKPVWIQNDKEREASFTEALRKADTKTLLKMIIMLNNRREKRLADGKKATSTDERYFHAAEDILYGELGVAFDKDKEEIKDFVYSSLF